MEIKRYEYKRIKTNSKALIDFMQYYGIDCSANLIYFPLQDVLNLENILINTMQLVEKKDNHAEALQEIQIIKNAIGNNDGVHIEYKKK